MLKQWTAWLLIFAVFAANCSRLLVYAGFNLNKSYIASTLCDNRAKPWMHCKGKCYFMKKIRQAEENERDKTSKDHLFRIETIFFKDAARDDGTRDNGVVIESKLPKIAEDRYQDFFCSRIFQPPRAC